MKITSLNLQGFMHWQQREESILAYLRRQDPDVILFQEVVYLPRVNPLSQVQLLDQHLHYPYAHSSISRLQVGTIDPVYREGLAVLSQSVVVKTDVIILKKAEDDPLNRIIQLIDVRHGNKLYKLANVHFGEQEKHASRHLAETLEILAFRGEQRIIMGDFNIPDLAAYADLWDQHYATSSTKSYISYPGSNVRIDYALLPKSEKFDRIAVSQHALSDHRALTITFEAA